MGASKCFSHLIISVCRLLGCQMSHLAALRAAQLAKVRAITTAGRVAALASIAARSPQEAAQHVDAVPKVRAPRACPASTKFDPLDFSELYTRRGSAYDEKEAAAADEARCHDLGHGYMDDDLVVEQLLALVGCPCANCGMRSTLSFAGSSRSGLGGSLDFTCDACEGLVSVMRGRSIPHEGPRRPASENTLRFVTAAIGVGLGFEATANLTLNLHLGTLCKTTWDSCKAKCAVSVQTALEKECEANLKEENMLTLLYEGDSAITAGKTMIRVITDGSWQKRCGRNSRCARCQTCISAKANGVAIGMRGDTHIKNKRLGRDNLGLKQVAMSF